MNQRMSMGEANIRRLLHWITHGHQYAQKWSVALNIAGETARGLHGAAEVLPQASFCTELWRCE